MNRPAQYGSRVYLVQTAADEQEWMADSIAVTQSGVLLLHGGFRKDGEAAQESQCLAAFAAGSWRTVKAVSAVDLTPVAKGQTWKAR